MTSRDVVTTSYDAGMTTPDEHTLTVFNAVDVPHDVQRAVMNLLNDYDPDIYERVCDASGKTIL